jgi:HEXXH motif-containing protein
MRTHTLTDEEFTDFAAGYGTPSGIAALRSGQLSRRLLMLRAILDDTTSSGFRDGYALLAEVQAQAPEAYRDTVTAPGFGTWTALTLRARRYGEPERAALLADQLGTFAAAAAIRARLDFTLDLSTVDGSVYLPGLGLAVTPERWVTVTGKEGQYRVGDVDLPDDPTADVRAADVRAADVPAADGPTTDGNGWTALHRLSATAGGLRLDVCLDDLDPWRDNHGLRVAGRGAGAPLEQWRSLTRAAWEVLVRHHRRYAQAIAAGLTTIVPLAPPSSGNAINATSMWAFGSVSLTPPATPLTLASSLLHEFQHAKLGALLDLYKLYDDGGARRLYAPWRDDPRPLGGLLQGVYAFQGVTDFWRTQRRVLTGAEERYATLEFARWRDQTWRALRTLMASGAFTERGRRFLDGMRATQDGWLADPVPADTAALAQDAGEDHWTAWRLRNVKVHTDDQRRLAAEWGAGAASTGPVRGQVVARDVRARARNARLELALLRINDPDRFEGTCAQPATDRGYTAADAAYARADYDTAVAGYRQRIESEPDDRSAWAGLALACARTGDPAAALWRSQPELVYAVHRAIGDTGATAPDPVRLAHWLAADAGGTTGHVGGTTDHVGGGSTTQ